MIDARSARNKSILVRNELVQKYIKEIEVAIYNAVNKGEFCISWYDKIDDSVLGFLTDLGYNINDYYSQKDGYNYSISW